MSQEPHNLTEIEEHFLQFVMVQVQNILFVLGKLPSPDGTLMPPNLQAGKLLIDQLEMIKHKTKGNLSKKEARILEDAISNVQLTFVEASGGTPASMMPSSSGSMSRAMREALAREEEEMDAQPEPEPPSTPQQPEPKPQAQAQSANTDPPEDNKKKFFKSYG